VCGAEWCSLDASSWSAHGAAFRSRAAFDSEAESAAAVRALAALAAGAPSAAPAAALGRGLKAEALAELEVTAGLEPFWREFLGATGADAQGRPAALDPAAAARRADVRALRVLSAAGVLREYPAARREGNRTANARREQWCPVLTPPARAPPPRPRR